MSAAAIYHAFKKATDGSGSRWGFVPNLTHDQARDEVRFPLGKHREADGTPYVWTYALMPAHIPSEKSALKALGGLSAPLPSAAGCVLSHLARKR